MYHDSYGSSRKDTPFRLTLMRGLTVIVFAFIFLNVPQWGKGRDSSPTLPPDAMQRSHEYVEQLLSQARATGAKYTSAYGAGDFDRLSALSSGFQAYHGLNIAARNGTPAEQALDRKLRYVREELGALAHYNDHSNVVGMMAITITINNAVTEYRKTHGPAARPDFLTPPPAEETFNWRHVAKRGVDGWLLAMIPAFLTISISFRLRRESLWAELVERPWAPVLATIFWPLGLWVYVGEPGVIERKLQLLVQAYVTEHHHAPDETWIAAQRLVLMRRARNMQHAFAQMAEYPELIRVNSRQAIFASWLVALLSGPMSMFLGVVQAYASVARAKAGIDSSLVDTTRNTRRKLSGFTDGYLEVASNGKRLEASLGRMRGKLVMEDHSIFLHLDCRTGKPVEAYGMSQYGPAKVMAGLVTPYPVFEYPPPWKALFRSSPGFGLLPSFSDFGVQGETRAGPVTMQFGLLTGYGANGSADDRTDAVLRLSGNRGAISSSASYQGGDEHDYAAGNLTLAGHLGSIGYKYAHRDDRDPKLDGQMHQIEVIGQRGLWRAGIQAAHAKQRTLLGVIERKLGGVNRLLLECLTIDGQAPIWTMRFQQGLALATP